MHLAKHLAILGIVSYLTLCEMTAFAQLKLPAKSKAAVTKAKKKALAWLKKNQNPDGSWGDNIHRYKSGITSFVLLAFLSEGYGTDKGRYKELIRKGQAYLQSCSRKNGFLASNEDGTMYCHALATTALSELYARSGNKKLRTVLDNAVKLIVETQSDEGGWRYSPKPYDADISITIMQLMALRAAENAMIPVPDATFQKGVAYVKKCHDPNSGGFGYNLKQRRPGAARTAAALCILSLSGDYSKKKFPMSLGYLQATKLRHYWYGNYYAVNAFNRLGGKEAQIWYANISKELLERQEQDGRWELPHSWDGGIVHRTATAVLILSKPTEQLVTWKK